MFTSKRLTFLYSVTPVHLGAGQALGVIDNPIQRERHTDHPCFAGSGIKGALRHAAREQWAANDLLERVFGPGPGPERDGAEHAGAISFADAQLVAFPVRSLRGVFVYVTSPLALQRMARLAAITDIEFPRHMLADPEDGQAVVLNDDGLLTDVPGGKALVLESYAFTPAEQGREALKAIAGWLSQHALPEGEAHRFFREKLKNDLVLVSDTQLTFFARNATAVEPHVRIDDTSGTADGGGLFFTENLPPESLMVSLAMASAERLGKGTNRPDALTAESVMGKITECFDQKTVQIGGDATTGRGQVVVSFVGGEA